MTKWKLIITILMMSLLSTGCKQETPRESANVVFLSAEQTEGVSGTTDTTALTLNFDMDPATLTAGNITVTGATKGALSGTGTTRTLAISNITVDNGQTVSVAISSPSGYFISSSPQTVIIYRKLYNLRDTGPAGGLIFYDKGSYSEGWRYLEAAPKSTEWTLKEWGKYGNKVGTEGEIGTGKSNTVLIVAKLNEAPVESGRAAQLCDALVYGGYNDWFLPSYGELQLMFENLDSEGVGDFANVTYWSSTEIDNQNAYSWAFGSGGGLTFNAKNTWPYTRAARAF